MALLGQRCHAQRVKRDDAERGRAAYSLQIMQRTFVRTSAPSAQTVRLPRHADGR
jgi:hypothetical protein